MNWTAIFDTYLNLSRMDIAKGVVEVTAIAIMLYYLLAFLQRTRAVAILRGLGILILVYGVAYVLKLGTITTLLRWFGAAILIAVPIVFQPELRRALEQIGQRGFWQRRRR